MADFRKALAIVLKHEGGFVDHPDDPGGATNFGVSLRFALACGDANGDGFLDLDIDMDGDVDVDDIRNMEEHHAADVYRREFWLPLKCDLIFDQKLATKLFDTGVNVGKRQAVKFLQRAVNSVLPSHGVCEPLADDGVIGPATLRAIELFDDDAWTITPAFRSEQAGFYRSLIMRNTAQRSLIEQLRKDGHNIPGPLPPDFSKFQRGWLRRAYS